MAQRKTKAIVVASPKEQTPRAPGPALLPIPLKHKYHYFNKQSAYTDTFFFKQVTRRNSVKNKKPAFRMHRFLVLQSISPTLLLFILNIDGVHTNFIKHSLKSPPCL